MGKIFDETITFENRGENYILMISYRRKKKLKRNFINFQDRIGQRILYQIR